MRTGEREIRQVVIVNGGLPSGRGMALRTGLSEIPRFMIRIISRLIIGLMTRPAVVWRSSVLSVIVALRTGKVDVRSREGKVGEIMIELRGLPAIDRVTFEALVREFQLGMAGIVGSGIIVIVARPAIHGQIRVVTVRVTLGAVDGGMRTGQRELRIRMVEIRRVPCDSRMAFLTSMRQEICQMIGLVRFAVLFLMA